MLALAAGLRLWGIEQNGWGADYYSAAVRSMSLSLHNFFFVAFDPAGFISVDKPPIALWWQVLFVKLLGYQGWVLILPQALLGIAGVALMHRIMRPVAGPAAAILAAAFLALTPVLVAINRTNNTDTALSFWVLVAAWAMLHALREARRAWLLGAMLAMGLAFNTKMLAAYIVLPALVLTYAALAPVPWRRRLVDLVIAGGVLAAVSLAWALAVELTPAQSRPYVGSSKSNSVLELMVGHNALGRFVSLLRPQRAEASSVSSASASSGAPALAQAASPGRDSASTTGATRSALSRLFVRTPAGPTRLFGGLLAAQAAWLLPLAIAGWLVWLSPGRRRAESAVRADLTLWTLWLVTSWAVFSATGGIMHFYYVALMAPALAALAGLGVPMAWRAFRDPTSGWAGLMLPAVLLAGALWQIHVHAATPSTRAWASPSGGRRAGRARCRSA